MCAAVAIRSVVTALLAACIGDTPATQDVAAGVLRNLAALSDLSAFHNEGALPLLLQLVYLGMPQPG
jgi:hypothetical protein